MNKEIETWNGHPLHKMDNLSDYASLEFRPLYKRKTKPQITHGQKTLLIDLLDARYGFRPSSAEGRHRLATLLVRDIRQKTNIHPNSIWRISIPKLLTLCSLLDITPVPADIQDTDYDD